MTTTELNSPLPRSNSSFISTTSQSVNNDIDINHISRRAVMVWCTIHLIALRSNTDTSTVKELLSRDSASYIIKGRPHGWVHRPQHNDTARLLSHDWDIFLLTEFGVTLPDAVSDILYTRLSVHVDVPKAQYDHLKSSLGSGRVPIPETPPLPNEWPRGGGIPDSAIDNKADVSRDRKVGELKLDSQMAEFLTNAVPSDVRNRPLSFFNLFRYPKKDSAVHDAYMEGFKQNFGPAAGAGVRFMGPVFSGIVWEIDGAEGGDGEESAWQDANLVQYDSIWHYAYMLSTEVYQELNQQKMQGLEDTCILLVSEVEYE